MTVIAVVPAKNAGIAVFRDGELHAHYTVQAEGGTGIRGQYVYIQRILTAFALGDVSKHTVICETPRRRLPAAEGWEAGRLGGWVEGLALTLGYQMVWLNRNDKLAFDKPATLIQANSGAEHQAIAYGLYYTTMELGQ